MQELIAALQNELETPRLETMLQVDTVHVIAALESVLNGDPDWCLRKRAVLMIGSSPCSRAIESLIRALTQDPPSESGTPLQRPYEFYVINAPRTANGAPEGRQYSLYSNRETHSFTDSLNCIHPNAKQQIE
jgi:hypothetical protein